MRQYTRNNTTSFHFLLITSPLILQNRPRLVIYSSVHQTLSKEFISSRQDISNRHASLSSHDVEMETFVATFCRAHKVEHLLGQRRAVDKLASTGVSAAHTSVVAIATVNEHAVAVGSSVLTTWRSSREIQVYVGRLEHVIVDFVEVLDRTNNVRANVALVGEGLETTPDTDVRVDFEIGSGVFLSHVGIDPALYINLSGTVVEAQSYVGRLGVDTANLADKRDLRNGGAINLELGSRHGFFGVDNLLDRYGSQGFILVGLRGLVRISNESIVYQEAYLATALAALL